MPLPYLATLLRVAVADKVIRNNSSVPRGDDGRNRARDALCLLVGCVLTVLERQQSLDSCIFGRFERLRTTLTSAELPLISYHCDQV
jgi:hypothetical protein